MRNLVRMKPHAKIAALPTDMSVRMLDALPAFIGYLNPEGVYDYVNQKYCEFTGQSKDFFIGKHLSEVIGKQTYAIAAPHFAKALQGERCVYVYTLQVPQHHHKECHMEVEYIPCMDEAGVVEGVCIYARDVTTHKEMERHLQAKLGHTQAASLAKSDFLANISHEIRTPMNAIVGLVNILEHSAPLTEKQKEFITTLRMSTQALTDLINDLLDITKIEAKHITLEELPFSPLEVIEECVRMMRMQAEERGLRLETRCTLPSDKYLIGDPYRIRQIVTNLVSNALKFTHEGSVEIAVWCGEAEADRCVLGVSVTDTGIGIAEEKLGSIFDKFTQADVSTTRKYGGTGLGLAISKSLSQMMGGDIAVKSQLGKGTTFTLTLPLPVAKIEMSSTEKEVPSSPDLIHNTPHVLIVEDHYPNVLVATTLLEEMGCCCTVASNGKEALRKLDEARFNLVLMDIEMEEINGYETTYFIREKEAGGKHIPIIAMTAHALSGVREKCVSAGMDDYIAKPFEPERFRQLLMKYLAKG